MARKKFTTVQITTNQKFLCIKMDKKMNRKIKQRS
jgi:hypothetical protein